MQTRNCVPACLALDHLSSNQISNQISFCHTEHTPVGSVFLYLLTPLPLLAAPLGL